MTTLLAPRASRSRAARPNPWRQDTGSAPGPNVWQQYDAGTGGSAWFATGATGAAINCTLATPCTLSRRKTRLPNARISLSLGITKGRDDPFVGAVDGLRINRTLVYDFEPNGVERKMPRARTPGQWAG